jgi:hypothetical protein
MRPPTRPLLMLAALIAIALSGCGLSDPYQTTTSHPAGSAAAPTAPPADLGDPAPERGGTIPTRAKAAQNRLAISAARSTPLAALERYAAIYLNWNANDVIAVQRELASISLGQARAQALQAAANAAHDPQLTESQLANQGHVIAISPGQTIAAGEWVIVTSEQTTGQGDYQGLPPTLHITYAQLTNTSHGWVITAWQPQN